LRDDDDAEAIVGILKLMYKFPEVGNACRRIVLKTFGENPRLEELWARAIKEVNDEGGIHEGMMDLLWRDYALLPNEHRSIIGDRLWQLPLQRTEIHTFLAALT
jgi:hypothetical protein